MEILYIPVKILNKMALWLTEQQNEYGAFVETAEHYYDRSFWVNTLGCVLMLICMPPVCLVAAGNLQRVINHSSTSTFTLTLNYL